VPESNFGIRGKFFPETRSGGILIDNIICFTALILLLTNVRCSSPPQLKPLPGSEVVEFSIRKDSLDFATTRDDLLYPFGKFRQPPKAYEPEFKRVKIYGDSNNVDSVLYLHSRDFSALFFFDSEDGLYHIVSGGISGNGISVLGGATVGASPNRFLMQWFQGEGFEKLKHIRMETGLTGTVYEIDLSDGLIRNIRITTDYQIEPF
jgi:hypothetical protein